MREKTEREKAVIRRFLEHYNEIRGTKYEPIVDRPDVIIRTTKQPDFICKDDTTGAEIAIEISMLPGPGHLKWIESASKFLKDVESRLEGKLPGAFALWLDVDKIEFTQTNRGLMIDQLCSEILRVASSLHQGKEAQLSKPFPCRLQKWQVQGSILAANPPAQDDYSDTEELRRQLEQALSEANEKFTNYAYLETMLLLGIWETGVKSDEFDNLLPKVDMNEYKNVKHIYLYDYSPSKWIHHLWPQST